MAYNDRKSMPDGDVPFTPVPPLWLLQEVVYPINSIPDRSSAHASQFIAGTCQDGIQTLHLVWFGGPGEGNIATRVMYCRISYNVDEVLQSPAIEAGDPFEPKNNDLFTYSEPWVIASVPDRACGNAVPFIDRNGRFHLWFAAFYTEGSIVPEGEEDPGRRDIFYQYSDDDCETWSEPVIWSDRPGLWIRNAMVVLDDGTWLFPINDEVTFLPEFDCDWSTRFVRSTDEGKTWEFSELYSIPRLPGERRGGIIQPTVVQLGDGSLLCLNRSCNGWIVEMRSFDKGITWTTPVDTALPNPESNVCMTRRRNGDLLLAYNPSHLNRNPISIARSTDDGKSWQRLFDLRKETGELSYPCILETPDGLVHCTYSLHRLTVAHDVFRLDS
jgi:hypothetical protein